MLVKELDLELRMVLELVKKLELMLVLKLAKKLELKLVLQLVRCFLLFLFVWPTLRSSEAVFSSFSLPFDLGERIYGSANIVGLTAIGPVNLCFSQLRSPCHVCSTIWMNGLGSALMRLSVLVSRDECLSRIVASLLPSPPAGLCCVVAICPAILMRTSSNVREYGHEVGGRTGSQQGITRRVWLYFSILAVPF